jgi:hypothetical protein
MGSMQPLLATAQPGRSTNVFATVTVAGIVEAPPEAVWPMITEPVHCCVFSDVKVGMDCQEILNPRLRTSLQRPGAASSGCWRRWQQHGRCCHKLAPSQVPRLRTDACLVSSRLIWVLTGC